MGLAAAYELCKKGIRAHVFERDDRLGGMSAHFDLAGTRLERYYHFVCGPDQTTFDYLKELGLEDRLHWVDTHMGFYCDGRLHDWGNPLALLRFPGLTFFQKLRYGLHLLHAKRITDWQPYDAISSTEWLQKWIGKRAYNVMWRTLFHYKFYEYENSLSAAWLGTRIKRVALSRKSLFQESLGYLEGGSETMLQALAARIQALGGTIELSTPIEEVLTEGTGPARSVRGIKIGAEERPFDAVISTIPLPYVNRLVPALPADEATKVAAINNVGVVCVVIKLKKPFTRNFWLNINDPRIEIPGLVEYTNLNPLDGSTIVYAPYYMPQSHPKYNRPAEAFVEETLSYLSIIRPDFDTSDVIVGTASRYAYAQTVCTPGFYEALPPMKSRLTGFFMADTSHYYPEDRSISESIRIGAELASLAAKMPFEPQAVAG
jgi:protoporphyrinogen oxidase